MIAYECKCKVCNYELTLELKVNDELPHCPKCLVYGLERLATGGTGFVLKGDGWAKDGYASGDKNDP